MQSFQYNIIYFLIITLLHWFKHLKFVHYFSENRRLGYSGLKFAYADGSDDESHAIATELPSCVYAAARSRLQLPLAAYVHQHSRQLHTGKEFV